MRLFFAWTPLHALMAEAASRAVPMQVERTLIWLGREDSAWKQIVTGFGGWRVEHWRSWSLLGFEGYLRRHGELREHLRGFIASLPGCPIVEVALPSDDEYVSLAFVRELARTIDQPLISLLEDGLALYIYRRPPRLHRHVTKYLLTRVIGRPTFATPFRAQASSPLFSRIYSVFPEGLPPFRGKIVVDTLDAFREVVQVCADSVEVEQLPPLSAVFLSENLAPTIMSRSAEYDLIARATDFLHEEGCQRIFSKPHHFDPPDKQAELQELGLEPLSLPSVPYEIVHDRLHPAILASFRSSALLYASILDPDCRTVAFCGGYTGVRNSAEFLRRSNVSVI